MKRILYVFLLCCIILSGCGREDQQQIGNTWDSMEQTRQQSTVPETPRTTVPPEQAGASLMLDRNQIFDIDLCDDSESGNHYVGMQFYKGEPVMLYLKTYLPVQIRLVDGEYRRDPLVADCIYNVRMEVGNSWHRGPPYWIIYWWMRKRKPIVSIMVIAGMWMKKETVIVIQDYLR